jgi:hypothetical protein
MISLPAAVWHLRNSFPENQLCTDETLTVTILETVGVAYWKCELYIQMQDKEGIVNQKSFDDL